MDKQVVIWKPPQMELLEMLANGSRDEDTGEKLTTRAIAKKLGVTRKTVCAWKRLPGFTEAVYSRAQELLHHRLPNIMLAMSDAAEEDRDVPAAKLVLELCGKLQDHDKMLIPFEALFIRLGATVLDVPEAVVETDQRQITRG